MPAQLTKVVPRHRLADRFVTIQRAIGLTNRNQDPSSEPTNLTILVEITRPWFPAASVGQTIISTLWRSFSKADSTSNIERFEQMLKQVNQALVELARRGETDWIGQLHSLIVLTIAQDVHISFTGDARAFLARDHNLQEITPPSQPELNSPEKTFGSIISGTLEPSDKIFITSSELFNQVARSVAAGLIGKLETNQAASEIASLILKDRLPRSVFGLIELDSNQPDEVIYLEEISNSLWRRAGRLMTQTLSWFSQVSRPLIQRGLQTSSAGLENVRTQARPRLKTITEQTIKNIRRAISWSARSSQKLWRLSYQAGGLRFKSKLISLSQKARQSQAYLARIVPTPAKPTTIQDGLSLKNRSDLISEGPSLIGKTLFTVHDYSLATGKHRVKPLRLIRLTWLKMTLLTRRVRGTIKLPQGKTLALVSAISALAIALVVSINVQKNRLNQRRQQTRAQELIQQARRGLEEGKTALVFGDTASAQRNFGQAIEAAKNLNNSSELAQEAQEIANQAAKQYDSLSGTTRFKELEPIVQLPASGRFLTENDGKIYTLDIAGRQVLGALKTTGTPAKVIDLAPDLGQILAGYTRESIIQLLTDQNKLVRVNLATETIEPIGLADGVKLAQSRDLAEFGVNLYLLSPKNNQIIKHPRKDDLIQAGENWLTDSINLKEAIGLTIDGAIYVLKQDGDIVKLSRGKLIDFKPTGLPPPKDKLTKPVDIWTDEAVDSVFVAESNRVVELDKQGRYRHQYIFDQIETISDFLVQPTGKKMTVLAGDKIYQANY